jgi:hypothetical protein
MVLRTSGYDLFVSQLKQVETDFPKLVAILGSGEKMVLAGEIDIIDSEGKHWESYKIEIHHSDLFPKRFPRVFEVGDKIPKIGDWHIYEDTQSCCIKVLPEEMIICRDGISVLGFIKYQVLPYFFNQTHRRVEGYYVNGEYSHGFKGLVEFYSRILMTEDPRKLIRFISIVAKGEKPGRTHLCFCGSGDKFRKCHRNSFEQLAFIDSEILLNHGLQIAEYFKIGSLAFEVS